MFRLKSTLVVLAFLADSTAFAQSSAPLGAAVLLVVPACSGCVRIEVQAVRHGVTAGWIERRRASEDHVGLVRVERASRAWPVRAGISSVGRAGRKRIVTWRVERSASSASGEVRWTPATVEDGKIEAVGADPKR